MFRRAVVASAFVLAAPVAGARDDAGTGTLINSARIVDGIGPDLIEGQDVLVQDGMIAAIGSDLDTPEGVTVIDAAGPVMTPGFIDMLYHLSLCTVPFAEMAGDYAPDLDYIGIKAAQAAEDALMRGFTSLRDVGGVSWGAKLTADRGEIAGILAQATANSGELLQVAGDRSSCPGVVGRIVEEAHADLRLIDGNPLEDISILEDHGAVLSLTMTACNICKNG